MILRRIRQSLPRGLSLSGVVFPGVGTPEYGSPYALRGKPHPVLAGKLAAAGVFAGLVGGVFSWTVALAMSADLPFWLSAASGSLIFMAVGSIAVLRRQLFHDDWR